MLLIGVGLVVALKGTSFFRFFAAIAVFVATSCLALYLCSLFTTMKKKVELVSCISCAIIMGTLAAFLVYRYIRISVVALGVVGGFCLGILIYFIIFTFEKGHSVIVMLMISITLAITGGILAFWRFALWICIFGTSGIGSYLFMRGWSEILGGWPSERVIIDALKDGKVPPFTNISMVWLFLSAWIVSAAY